MPCDPFEMELVHRGFRRELHGASTNISTTRNRMSFRSSPLSPKEWAQVLAHVSTFVRAHPRRGLALGGIVLDGETIETRQRFLGNLPLPLRAVFTMFGDRIYAGYRAQVYGLA